MNNEEISNLLKKIINHDPKKNFLFNFSKTFCVIKGKTRASIRPYTPKSRRCSCCTPPNLLPELTAKMDDAKVIISIQKFEQFKKRIFLIYIQEGNTWEEKIANFVKTWCNQELQYDENFIRNQILNTISGENLIQHGDTNPEINLSDFDILISNDSQMMHMLNDLEYALTIEQQSDENPLETLLLNEIPGEIETQHGDSNIFDINLGEPTDNTNDFNTFNDMNSSYGENASSQFDCTNVYDSILGDLFNNDMNLSHESEWETFIKDLIDDMNKHCEDNFFFDFNAIICNKHKKKRNVVHIKPYLPKEIKCSCHKPPNSLPIITGETVDDKVRINLYNFKEFKERIIIINKQNGKTWEEKTKNYVANWCNLSIDNPHYTSTDIIPDSVELIINSAAKDESTSLGKRTREDKFSNLNQNTKKKRSSQSPLTSKDNANCILWKFHTSNPSMSKYIPLNNGTDISVDENNKLFVLENDFRNEHCVCSYNFNLETVYYISIGSNILPNAIGINGDSLYTSFTNIDGTSAISCTTIQIAQISSIPKFQSIKILVNRIIHKGILTYICGNHNIYSYGPNGFQENFSCLYNIIDFTFSSDIHTIYFLDTTSLYKTNLETGEFQNTECLLEKLQQPISLTYVENAGNPHIIIAEMGNNSLIDVNLNTIGKKNISLLNHTPIKLHSYEENIFCISVKDTKKEKYSTQTISERVSNDFHLSHALNINGCTNIITDTNSQSEIDQNTKIEHNNYCLNVLAFLLCHPFKTYDSYKMVINKLPDIVSYLKEEHTKTYIPNSVALIEILSQFNQPSNEIIITRTMKNECGDNTIGRIGVINEDKNVFSNPSFKHSNRIGVITHTSSVTANHQHIHGDTLVSIWGTTLVRVKKINSSDISFDKAYFVVIDSSNSTGDGEIVSFGELMKLPSNYLIVGKCLNIANNIFWHKSDLPNHLQQHWSSDVIYANVELLPMNEQSAYNYLEDLQIFPIQCFKLSEDTPIDYKASKEQPITLHGYDIDFRRQSIKLPNSNITGCLSQQLFSLKYLRKLDLSNNNISGTIPSDINYLSNLQELILSNNELEGILPFTDGKLKNLAIILLNNNKFSGEIPSCIGKMTYLNTLNLSNNQLEGSIPDSIGDISKLQYLYLQGNQLSGNIPSLNKLEIIAEIDLGDNNLSSISNDFIGFNVNTNVSINLFGNKKLDTINIPQHLLHKPTQKQIQEITLQSNLSESSEEIQN